MADRHYAIVLSALSYNRIWPSSARSPAAPGDGPSKWALPANLLPDKQGVGAVTSVIVADAVRQVDYREREWAFIAEAPRAVVEEVLDKLLAVPEEE
jgi:hypothetical protein